MGLVEEWLDHLRLDLGKSPYTVATYARTMRTLPSPETASRDDILAWSRSRADKSPATRNNERAAVRSFYRWARRFDRLSSDGPDPAEWLDAVVTIRGSTPEWVGLDELERLYRAADPELRRAVCLGAWAGLRVSEAAAAHWRDFDREHMFLRVRSKGRVRLIGVDPLLLDELLPDTAANIITAGKALTPGALARRLAGLFDRAGVDATFHGLRHRYGMLALAGTDDIAAVARAMGHASTDTTRLYAAASDSQLHKIAAAVVRRIDVKVSDAN